LLGQALLRHKDGKGGADKGGADNDNDNDDKSDDTDMEKDAINAKDGDDSPAVSRKRCNSLSRAAAKKRKLLEAKEGGLL